MIKLDIETVKHKKLKKKSIIISKCIHLIINTFII